MSSTQISHHASNTNGSGATTTNAVAHNSCQYVVSRNGIILPWQQIHQQYQRVVQDDDNNDTNHYACSTAFSNQQQQQQINNNINMLQKIRASLQTALDEAKALADDEGRERSLLLGKVKNAEHELDGMTSEAFCRKLELEEQKLSVGK